MLMEDITQEVFLKAYCSLKTYSQKSPFENWLLTITVRVCYRQLQKRKSRRENLAGDILPEESEALDNFYIISGGAKPNSPERTALLRDVVDKVLKKLSPREKMVLILSEVEGMSAKEIAQLMGLSGLNVKVSNFRAKKRALKIFKSLSQR
jgi:RNA polymerase sigma-70 factor (ECF subfamily)